MRKVLVAALAAFGPGVASAVDMDFYTWNAFDETVSAFQRLALVLADPGFLVFVLVFAVAGIIVGSLAAAAKGFQGAKINPIGWMIPAIIGVAVFKAFVIPTGTLFVYDPVRNATQAVGDVPDGVVLLAGMLNKVERGVKEIVTSASANPDAERSGALRYGMVLNALNARTSNLSLERNLVNYYMDCAVPSAALGYNGVSQREIERQTTDLYDTFAKAAHPSLATYAFTGADDTTATMTCADMWNNVLTGALGGPGALEDVRNVVCAQSGFDIGAGVQIDRCNDELRTLGELFGVTGATDWLPFIRSAQIAVGITNALRSGDISVAQGALVDRQVMSEGMGVAEALDRWVPKLKGFMTAAVLGMVPLCLLFLVTPMMGKALQLCVGLFLWLSLWGICDAVAVVMATDAAADAFQQVSNFGFSHTAFVMAPENAVQALGVFGKARGLALMMSTVLSYALFQFGGYAFTSLASTMQNDIAQAGEAAGRQTMYPEERAAALGRLAGSPGTEGVMNQYGMPAMAAAGAKSSALGAREVLNAQQYVRNSISGGVPASSGAGGLPPVGIGEPDPNGGMGSVGGSGSSAGAASPGGAGYVPSGMNGSLPGERDPNEVLVTPRPPPSTAPPRTSAETPSVFTGFFNKQADISTGASVGEIQGREGLGIPLFDQASMTSQFQTTKTQSALIAERGALDTANISPVEAGAQQGRIEAGRTAVTSDALGAIADRNDWNAQSDSTAREYALAERSGLVGAIDAADSPTLVGAASQRTLQDVAFAQQTERDRSAAQIGRTSAISADIRADATDATLSAFGKGDMTAGETFSQMTQAASGGAAKELDMPSEARRIGAWRIAEAVGHTNVMEQLSGLVGIDPRSTEAMRRVSVASEGSRQSITVDATGDERKELATRLGLDEQGTRALLNSSGPVKLSVALAEDGAIATGTVETGNQVYDVTRTMVENVYSERSTSSIELGGGRAFIQNREQFASTLDHVWSGNSLYTGVVTEDVDKGIWALAGGLSNYLRESAVTIHANAHEAVNYQFGASASGGVGVPGESAGIIRGSATVSSNVAKSETDSRNTQYELDKQYTHDLILSSRTEAVESYRRNYGAIGSENESSARAQIIADMQDRIYTKLSSLKDAAVDEAETAAKGYDAEPEYSKAGNAENVSTRTGIINR
jgi:hypothetical protein